MANREGASHRRDMIKNIAIVFLSLMLVLTFFSNTILNMTLPQVSASWCGSGSITTQVRGSGAVEAAGTYAVISPSSSTVADVGVKKGAKVEAGDVMFRIAPADSDDVVAAVSTLAELQSQLADAKAALNPDYTDMLNEISNLRADLAAAKAASAGYAEAKERARTAERTLNDLKERASALEAKRAAAQSAVDAYDEVLHPLPESAEAAKIALDAALEACSNAKLERSEAADRLERARAAADDADEAYADAQAALSDAVAAPSDDTLTAKRREVEKLKTQYDRAVTAYNDAKAESELALAGLYTAWQSAVNKVNAAWSEYSAAMMNGGDVDAARINWENAQKAADDALDKYNKGVLSADKDLRQYEYAIADASTALSQAKEDLSALETEYAAAMSDALEYDSLKSAAADAKKAAADAKKALEAAQAAKTAADDALTEAEEAYLEAKNVWTVCTQKEAAAYYASQLEELNVRIDKASDEYDAASDALASLSGAGDDKIKELERSLAKAQSELDKQKAADAGKYDALLLKVEVIEEQIAKQQEKLDALRSGAALEIKAPVSGTVVSVSATAGEAVDMNDELALIRLDDKGFKMSFVTTAEQASRIKPGDKAEATNYWRGSLDITVDSIAPDTADPHKNRIVTLHIDGDITVGTNLSVTIGSRVQQYDTVIPNTALHQDSSGYFVLTLEAKQTPLGNRYTARRADVTVLASDDANTAVGGLQAGTYIITASAAPVEAGAQVRLGS